MNEQNNPNYPDDDETTPSPNTDTPPPPPAFGDPEPPAYGDPMTPPQAPDPLPPSPPPGLPPSPSSVPNSPDFAAPGSGSPNGSLTNPNKDERNWAMFAHVSAIVAALILSFTSIPAFGFLGPLIIYLVKKDESPFIAAHAKEALNFNISVGIVLFAMWFLALILVWTIIVPVIMIAFTGIVGLGALVLVIIAAVKASNGEPYQYPLTLRLIN